MNRSNFRQIKLYAGAMSKNCIDAILSIPDIEQKIGFISSRRQIDFCGGYVNNWTTEQYSKYVKKINKNFILCRDHGGPGQGLEIDDGLVSFTDDAKYFDLIHIDPWKHYNNLKKGTSETIKSIKEIHKRNNSIFFEVGTEESIRRFEVEELEYFLENLKLQLTKQEFNKIVYCVIQSGVGLDLRVMKNTGKFSKERLVAMIKICKRYDLLTKEHNSDYLRKEELTNRFKLGLDAANIAPELGQIESIVYSENCSDVIFQEFYMNCFNSNKWKKWTGKDFNPNEDKKDLVKICGHYIFSQNFCQENFLDKNELSKKAKKAIKERIEGLISDDN
jgi:hypothetical protein